MSRINEIKEVLTFLEKKFEVEFQLKILDEQNKVKYDEKIVTTVYKGCNSKIHNTDYLFCKDYYKKTF
jgi:hypothetical protein